MAVEANSDQRLKLVLRFCFPPLLSRGHPGDILLKKIKMWIYFAEIKQAYTHNAYKDRACT